MLWSHCSISTHYPRRTSRSCLVGAAVSGASSPPASALWSVPALCRTGACVSAGAGACVSAGADVCRRRGLCRLRLRRFCRTARRTLLRTRQIVADHRSSCRNIVKDRLCNARRQVDTAVGTARLVNRTAKTASPLRISCIPIPLLNGIQ